MNDLHAVELEHWRAEGWIRLEEQAHPPIPVDNGHIIRGDQEILRVDQRGDLLWRHVCAGKPTEAHVSSNRLLVLTESLDYHAWGHLGPALLLDLADGALIAELRGERAAALNSDHFVLGLEGYGVFATWLHGHDGRTLTEWPTYGHYVVDPGGVVRVVECDRRIPTNSRVVRLLPDGALEPGPSLHTGQAPHPVTLADGTILVLDSGAVRAIDRDLNDTVLAELLPIPRGEQWRFRGELSLNGAQLAVSIVERQQNPAGSLRFTSHRWTFSLGYS